MAFPIMLFWNVKIWSASGSTVSIQGHSFEINVRAVLAFREIGRGHTAMTTFTKILNIPSPPTCRNFTKTQNKKLLPIVKQLANDSMNTSAMEVNERSGSDEGECGISLDGREVTHRTMAWLPLYRCTPRNVLMLK
jgi:hypothetical protein